MEEVVQTLVEEGTLTGERGNYRLEETLSELHISPTVKGVLAARIDRLTSEEKELLQQLSVIGREFPLGLVKRVVSQSEEKLYRVLSSLQAKEFLYKQPAFPEVEYLFKHALTQEVAYSTVLQEQRKVLHERTGQAIEALYKDSLEDHYSELAHHYSQSDNTEKAVEYLYLAGQQAIQRSAHMEGIGYLTSALRLLETLPDTAVHAQQELALQVILGSTLIVTRGFGNTEAGQAYARARELCQQLGDTPELFSVLWGVWGVHVVREECTAAHELTEQLFRLAQASRGPALLVIGHYGRGWSEFVRGGFVQAHSHFEQGVALYKAKEHHSLASLYSYDQGVACLTYAAWMLVFLGYPTQAMKRIDQSFALARKLAHPFSLAFTFNIAAFIYLVLREWPAAQQQAEAIMALSEEQGFQFYAVQGAIHWGYAIAKQGHATAGLAKLHAGIQAHRVAGTDVPRAWHLSLLAEVYNEVGQVEEGLSALNRTIQDWYNRSVCCRGESRIRPVTAASPLGRSQGSPLRECANVRWSDLDEALTIVAGDGIRFWEADLYRLKGALCLKAADEGATGSRQIEAETYFVKAIEIARQQRAKLLELCTATSLARLWQSQDKKAEARNLLTPVYTWFTEGFDTADLKDAKALLAELS